MATTSDFTAIFRDFFGAAPAGFPAFQDGFRTTAAFGEKASKLALDALGQSADLSGRWTRQTLDGLGELTRAPAEPAGYSKALRDFATSQSGLVSQYGAAFGDVARQLQAGTLELMLAASRKASEDLGAAVQKATETARAAAPQAAGPAA